MSKLRKKNRDKIFIIFIVTILCHYFVLTFFTVDSTESFDGEVKKIDVVKHGLFPMAKINFAVTKDDEDGNQKIISKTISLIERDVDKFRVGKKYHVKSHHNWLISKR